MFKPIAAVFTVSSVLMCMEPKGDFRSTSSFLPFLVLVMWHPASRVSASRAAMVCKALMEISPDEQCRRRGLARVSLYRGGYAGSCCEVPLAGTSHASL